MSPRGQAGTPPEDRRDLPSQVTEHGADEATRGQDLPMAIVDEADEVRRPATHAALAFDRSFRRHVKTGSIFAVELVDGRLNGALLCTRPEELTHGALPVLAITGDTEMYREGAGHTEPWEPKYDTEAGIKKLATLDEEISTLDTKIEQLGSRKKKLAQDREMKVAEMRRIIGHLRTGQRDLLDGVPHEQVGAPAESVSAADVAVLAEAQPATEPVAMALP